MTKAGETYVDVIPELKDFGSKLSAGLRSEVDKVGASTTSLGSKITSGLGKSLTTVGKVGAVAFAGLAVGAVAMGKASVAAFQESASVGAQTAAVIKSTGGAAGITAKQVGALASSVRDYSGIDDEAVQAGENMLLTFRNIRNESGKGNDIFTQSTKVLADLSTAMGTDMKTSAVQLGKALNDPVKGITALTRVGVTFDDEQKKQIAQFVKAGDTASAQKVILAELTKEFGGSAAAMGKANPAGILQSQLGDLQETLGQAILPIATGLLKVVQPALQQIGPVLAQFIGALGPLLQPVVAALGPVLSTLAKAFVQILTALGPLIPPLLQLVIALLPLVTLVAQIASGILGLLVPALSAIIGVLAKVLGAVVGFVTSWQGAWETVKSVGIAIWNAIKAAASAVFGTLKTVVMAPVNAILGLWRAEWNAIKSAGTTIWSGIKSAASTTFNALKTAVLTPMNALKTAWSNIWTGMQSVASGIWNGIIAALKTGINGIIHVLNGFIHAYNLIPFHSDIPTIPTLATGTSNFGGGLALVGERGPELVNMPRGAQVFPADQTRAMLGGGGGPTIGQINLATVAQDPDDIIQGIEWALISSGAMRAG